MTLFKERLESSLTDAGMSKVKFAELLEVNDQNITHWISRNGVSKGKLFKAAKILNVDPEWLNTGTHSVKEIAEEYNPPNTDKTTLTAVSITGKIPVISWTTAGDWHEIASNLQDYDADEWIPAIGSHSAQTYALRIRGDSMEPTIPNGSTIVVDPAIPADSNRVVVIRQNGDTEATCKRLIIEGGKRYLKPDNPRYPILEMLPDAVICGVAVKIVADL
ncbi:MAG: hypothetical protein DRQ89_14930 [Epsilonproteobacteria bacterium]|nr:MAG: hypothetical protein DRQ89_14930 [Campylobacterota bacterium]